MPDIVRSTTALIFLFLTSNATSTSLKIVGGSPASLNLFPEIAYFPKDKPDCAAVVISKQLAVTAAHCLPRNSHQNASIKMIHQGKEKRFKCNASPYFKDKFHDLAVCKTQNTLDGPYATLPSRSPEIGQRVMLTGFGCGALRGPSDREGVFRTGRLRVKFPTGELHDLQFVTEGKIHLCQGDSGAPIFKTRITSRSREVYGINSRTDLTSKSYFTDLAHPLSIEVINLALE